MLVLVCLCFVLCLFWCFLLVFVVVECWSWLFDLLEFGWVFCLFCLGILISVCGLMLGFIYFEFGYLIV